jgi:hypothetical protein
MRRDVRAGNRKRLTGDWKLTTINAILAKVGLHLVDDAVVVGDRGGRMLHSGYVRRDAP